MIFNKIGLLLLVSLFCAPLQAGTVIETFIKYSEIDKVKKIPDSLNIDILNGDQAGTAQEHFDLGVAYFYGYSCNGVTFSQSYYNAAQCFLKAFNKDHGEAALYLGMMYEDGKGVKRSKKSALGCYHYAIKKGFDQATYRLGCLFLKKKITSEELSNYTEQDLKPGAAIAEFFELVKPDFNNNKIEKINKIEKCFVVGKLWLFGGTYKKFKIPRNLRLAKIWLSWAADYPYAKLYSGMLCEDNGEFENACNFYKEAGALEFGWAWYRLGVLYFTGNNVILHNKKLGKMYLEKAIEAGNTAAEDFLKNCE